MFGPHNYAGELHEMFIDGVLPMILIMSGHEERQHAFKARVRDFAERKTVRMGRAKEYSKNFEGKL